MTGKLPGSLSSAASGIACEALSPEVPAPSNTDSRASRSAFSRSSRLGGLQPRTSGAATGPASTASAARTTLSSNELPLAGYLLARALDGRPVPSPDVNRLRRANASVNETRDLLRFGRGNVHADVRATNNESRWRMKAATTLKDEFYRRTGQPFVDFRTQATHSAAAATVFGAGNCGEHASTTSVYHSRRLENQETVHYVSGQGLGHAWSEARLPAAAGVGESERTVVMDAWAEGPAVLAPDARFAKQRDRARSMMQFDSSSGREARIATNDLVLETRAKGPAEIGHRIRSGVTLAARFTAFVDSMLPSGIGDWSTQHVIDDAFAKRVSGQLDAPAGQTLALEQAARIADQLGIGGKHRAAEAPRIVEAARALLNTVGGAQVVPVKRHHVSISA